MPLGILEIYQKEMLRIDASEQLSLVHVTALGGGKIEKRESSRMLKNLQRTAQGRKEKSVATAHALAGMGIGIEVIKREDKG